MNSGEKRDKQYNETYEQGRAFAHYVQQSGCQPNEWLPNGHVAVDPSEAAYFRDAAADEMCKQPEHKEFYRTMRDYWDGYTSVWD